MKMLEKIRLWWKFDGRYYHKEFVSGIKNLWRWFPTIWKDRDWDQYHIYELLAKKLEYQAQYIAGKDRHTAAQRSAERMLLCARLIRIQQEDLYATEYLDYYKEDHMFVPLDDTKKWYTVESTLIEDNLDEYFGKYAKQYKQYADSDQERWQIAHNIAHNNQQRSHRLLFKIMQEHIEGWWD